MLSVKNFSRYVSDPTAFRNELIVDVDGTARRFGDCMDDWQRNDFAALDRGLMRSIGRSTDTGVMRAYLERPRGHSKTTDLAVLCVYSLAFSNRPLRGYCYAADRDQAALLRDAIANLVRLNPWIGQILEVQKASISNIAAKHPGEGGTLTIESSDVSSSYGILPDLIIADELTHWLGDGALWQSLISSAAKRSNCLLVVISNAGFADSWQWDVREAARTDEAWYFSRLNGPVASWMTPDRLAEQRRMLPNVAYRRLWENLWSSGGGDALTPGDIDAAFVADYQPMAQRTAGWLFVAGVDLGLTRDCSAVVVLAVPAGGQSGQIVLVHAKLWQPTAGRKIDLTEVEKHILKLDETYGLECVAFDPWQMEHLAQRLEADSGHRRRNAQRRHWSKPWMREMAPTAANLREQATLVIESFKDRRLTFFPYEPLKQDLLKLRVEEKSYGIRLSSPRDGDGHGDTFSAFALALVTAHDLAGQKSVTVGTIQNAQDIGLTPLQRAINRSRSMEQTLADEMMQLHLAGCDPRGLEGWRMLMSSLGRN